MIGCRKLGIDMALDDFGTGYSSINMLLKYPFRIIKLARELIVESTASVENSNPLSTVGFRLYFPFSGMSETLILLHFLLCFTRI